MELDDQTTYRRFAEICQYAQRALGGDGSRLVTQRELAESLGCAPTMVTRYLHSGADFFSLKSRTIVALARACRLEPGTLFVWIEHGREKAMEYQRCLGASPMASSLDLAEELLSRMREEAKAKVATNGPDYDGLIAFINQERQQGGLFFTRLTESLNAEHALAAALESQLLTDEDWEVLARLLDADLRRFRFPF